MQIVGIEHMGREASHVHTIDVWYSQKRRMWIVERLDAEGHQIGMTHRCASEHEAAACLEEWLRAHSETHLVAPKAATAAEMRVLSRAA